VVIIVAVGCFVLLTRTFEPAPAPAQLNNLPIPSRGEITLPDYVETSPIDWSEIEAERRHQEVMDELRRQRRNDE